jgi:uncharacterized membrane protein (UPF0127 family)
VRFAPLAAVLAAMIACAPPKAPEPPRPPPRVVFETAGGGRPAVTVELARTPEDRERGLMYRERLAADAGMLFLFDESSDHEFWMKNTQVPLDMIFVGEDGRVVGVVERAEPFTLTGRGVGRPSRYVVEVNAGWTAANGVRTGDRVVFENVPR